MNGANSAPGTSLQPCSSLSLRPTLSSCVPFGLCNSGSTCQINNMQNSAVLHPCCATAMHRCAHEHKGAISARGKVEGRCGVHSTLTLSFIPLPLHPRRSQRLNTLFSYSRSASSTLPRSNFGNRSTTPQTGMVTSIRMEHIRVRSTTQASGAVHKCTLGANNIAMKLFDRIYNHYFWQLAMPPT